MKLKIAKVSAHILKSLAIQVNSKPTDPENKQRIVRENALIPHPTLRAVRDGVVFLSLQLPIPQRTRSYSLRHPPSVTSL
ncbi:hypothetical protein PM082_012311 [Marasmius tenuissimus]|nr:hypothetical protein PM082_012311 [Marasmius tenuissimus]